jgi:1,4-alpha-glucan branching enzyme
MSEILTRVQQGTHHDPFEWLGVHPAGNSHVVRAFMPSAESLELDGIGPMQRVAGTDTFELVISPEQRAQLPLHYRLNWVEKGSAERHSVISPYSFAPVLSEFDLNLFSGGKHLHVYRLPVRALGTQRKTGQRDR